MPTKNITDPGTNSAKLKILLGNSFVKLTDLMSSETNDGKPLDAAFMSRGVTRSTKGNIVTRALAQHLSYSGLRKNR